MKRIIISAIVIAAVIILIVVACGGSGSKSSATPAGTWNFTVSAAPKDVLGQYSITQSTAGTYVITAKTAIKVPPGNCSLPPGTKEGTLSKAGGHYSGSEKGWNPSTCAYINTTAFTAALSGGGNVMTIKDASLEPISVILTRG
jgi:hypothetical protein